MMYVCWFGQIPAIGERDSVHTNFLLHKEILQRAITPRELAPSPYFLLCRYTLLMTMCLQKLLNIHHCVFKILGKNPSVADGHIDGRTM